MGMCWLVPPVWARSVPCLWYVSSLLLSSSAAASALCSAERLWRPLLWQTLQWLSINKSQDTYSVYKAFHDLYLLPLISCPGLSLVYPTAATWNLPRLSCFSASKQPCGAPSIQKWTAQGRHLALLSNVGYSPGYSVFSLYACFLKKRFWTSPRIL